MSIIYIYGYMKNLVKDNLQSAMKFNGTMRYIDDVLTLNNRVLLLDFLILIMYHRVGRLYK